MNTRYKTYQATTSIDLDIGIHYRTKEWQERHAFGETTADEHLSEIDEDSMKFTLSGN